MTRTPLRISLHAFQIGLALLVVTFVVTFVAGCGDKEACRPYVAEVVGVVQPPGSETPQTYAKQLQERVAAVTTKYADRQKQCRGRVSQALQKQLVANCVADKRPVRSPHCPPAWSQKRCCQLRALCTLRYPTAADYCDWEPHAPPPPALPRCATCPGCVREGTTPPPPQQVNLWLGGDRDTLALVLDRPVNDSWLLPVHAPPSHLEPLLYALWKQPGYLAPNVAIVQGELVSVDAWNTLEQALRQGGWGSLGLNFAQWHGRFHCSARPPATRHLFEPGKNTVTVAIADGAIQVDGKQLMVLEKGLVSPEAKGQNPTGFIIPPLFRKLQSTRRPNARADVLRVTIRRGQTAHARLVAEIIYTALLQLKGAHARIQCDDRGPVK